MGPTYPNHSCNATYIILLRLYRLYKRLYKISKALQKRCKIELDLSKKGSKLYTNDVKLYKIYTEAHKGIYEPTNREDERVPEGAPAEVGKNSQIRI